MTERKLRRTLRLSSGVAALHLLTFGSSHVALSLSLSCSPQPADGGLDCPAGGVGAALICGARDHGGEIGNVICFAGNVML